MTEGAGRLALIAGAGALPAAVCVQLAEAPFVAALDGFAPDGLVVDQVFRLERLAPFLQLLADRGIRRVLFAGAVQRPRLDPALFDARTVQMLPQLLSALQGGDDGTLRAIVALFEEAGLEVVGVTDVAPDLVPGVGVLAGLVTEADRADATRAAAIVKALGAVDVGQGAVVQQGLCLGVETLAGTDALLAGVAALPAGLRPDAGQGRGVFLKAPKPGQDRRVDLPTIGPATVAAAAAAGLSGIAWEAGGVIVLDRKAMIAAAKAAGMFLWAREP